MPIGIGRGRGLSKPQEKQIVAKNEDDEAKINMDDLIEEYSLAKKVTYIPDDEADDYEKFTNTGINFDKYDEVKIKVTGDEGAIDSPIISLEELKIPEFLLNNIKKQGLKKLTPIQSVIIPLMDRENDFIACAQTGSGKTAAFLLPIIKWIHENPQDSSNMENRTTICSPTCLILSPTRELCRQIYTFSRIFSNGSENIKVAYCYGGVEMAYNMRTIQNASILVITPGRLVHLLNSAKLSMSKSRFIVLDEADKLLQADSFNECIEMLFTRVKVSTLPYQISMFSATFPKELQYYAKTFLREYLFISVGEVGAACSDICQDLIQVEFDNKLNAAIDIIKEQKDEKTLIFVTSKRQADFYGIRIGAEGKTVTTIHGDRDQQQREQALNDFRCNRVQYLVATDVASRGLDIPLVDVVINVDMPETIDIYVHRIGRTGRCGNVGKSVSLFDMDRDGRLAVGLVRVLEQASQEVPLWLKSLQGSWVDRRDEIKNNRGNNRDVRSGVSRNTLVLKKNGDVENKRCNDNVDNPSNTKTNGNGNFMQASNNNDEDEEW